MAFNLHTLGEDVMERLGIEADIYNDAQFNLLKEIGFRTTKIETRDNKNKDLEAIDTSDVEAHQVMEVEIEMSDDKYNKLKELFEEHGSGLYSNKEQYLKVIDALEL